MKKSRTINTLINACSGILFRGLTMILSLVNRTVFIAFLGLEYAGVSGLFADILLILSFAELGISSAITYQLYQPIAKDDHVQIQKIMSFYRKAYHVIALVVFLLGVAFIPLLKFIVTDVPSIKENLTGIYFLYVVNTAVSYLFVYKTTLLYAQQEQYVVVRWQGLISIVQVILQLVFLCLTKNYIVYLLITILSTVLQNAFVSHVVDIRYPYILENGKEGLSKEEQKTIFKDVKALFLYKVSGVVLNGTDSLIISRMLGVKSVGLLSNYKLISGQVNSVVYQVFNSATASIGNLAVNDKDKQYSVFRCMYFLSFWCYAVCSTCLFSLLNEFIANIWINESCLLPMTFVMVFVAEFFLKGMQTTISAFRSGNGLFIDGQYRPLIMSIINIVVSVVLVHYMGITGVLLGTVVSRVSTQLWYDPWLLYSKLFNKRFKSFLWMFCGYCCVIVSSCALSIFFGTNLVFENEYISFIIHAIISFAVPNIIIFLIYRKTPEMKYVFQTARNVINTFKERKNTAK